MKNLGKILFFILLTTSLNAHFEVHVSDNKVSLGNEVVVTFISDKNGDFPIVSAFEGDEIQSTSTEQSTRVINGKISGVFKRHHLFVPTKSLTIPSFEMKENGTIVKSAPIKIEVVKEKNDNPNAELFFKVTASKKEVVVGEPFFVTLVYKQHKDLDVIDRRLTPPSGKHFWVEPKPIESKKNVGSFETITLKYIFTPQKAGELTINPSNIKVGERSFRRDAWGMLQQRAQYKTLFSDDIKIKVKPLPKGVEHVGDYTFEVHVDKDQSNEKDPINLSFSIKGEGNIQDIAPFDLAIDKVLVYDEEPLRKNDVQQGHYYGTFTQKFALIGDRNYTIPEQSFTYYSLKQKKVVTLKSKAIPITIMPSFTAPVAQKVKVEKGETAPAKSSTMTTVSERSWVELFVMAFVGFVLGFISSKLSFKGEKKLKQTRLKLNDQKALLQQLMPYASRDKEAKAIVELLSGAIYEKKSIDLDKKALQILLKKLGLHS